MDGANDLPGAPPTTPDIHFQALVESDSGPRMRFAVRTARGSRIATVLLSGGGHLRFPHGLDASGETLGFPSWDARLRERAMEIRAILTAVVGCSSRRRRLW